MGRPEHGVCVRRIWSKMESKARPWRRALRLWSVLRDGVPGAPTRSSAQIRARIAELDDALPVMMIYSLRDQLKRIDVLEQDIDRLEQRIGAWQKQEAACRAIAEVPGIGKLTVWRAARR
jgi:transposase